MATVFGSVSEAGLAKLLPLLAQRRTRIDNERLRIVDHELKPRVKAEPGPRGGLRVILGLTNKKGEWLSLDDGRLLAGSQAFYLVENRAFPVDSPAPWELTSWAKEHRVLLDLDVGPARRDQLTRELRKAGIPEEDLELLAVQRLPPRAFVVTFEALPDDIEEPTVYVHLEADYGTERTPIFSTRPTDPYIKAADGHGMLERDLVSEESARREIQRIGFKFDKAEMIYVARGEVALKAMDPNSKLFPPAWYVIRGEEAPKFHQDLDMTAEVALLEDRGLLDLKVDITAVDDDSAVEALIDMKDLLKWLATGKKYIRLADGSFVAPSAEFRKSLRVLEDLGADSDRALISPLCVGLLRAIGDKEGVRAADEATKAWLAELNGDSAPESVEPPEQMKAILRDYQRRGLDWLSMLHRHKLTGILADGIGPRSRRTFASKARACTVLPRPRTNAVFGCSPDFGHNGLARRSRALYARTQGGPLGGPAKEPPRTGCHRLRPKTALVLGRDGRLRARREPA
ncbi:MAG: SNF2 helicase associated domain-containing protein, partial [Myxococcota bacterium]